MKLTRKQMFTDVPEEIRSLSHFTIKHLAKGGWLVSVRRLRKPIETRTVATKEELATMRAELIGAGLVGAFADVDRTEKEIDRDEQVFAPPANPRNIRSGRGDPYKEVHGATVQQRY